MDEYAEDFYEDKKDKEKDDGFELQAIVIYYLEHPTSL